MTSIADVVFTKMRPMTFYRPKDLAEEAKIKKEYVSAALREIARGGAIERIVDGRRVVYITKQYALF